MINEIKRRLDAGETVELECIDRDGFLNARKASRLNESILKLDVLEVECVDHLAVFLVGDCPGIIPSDLKYFKIKEDQDEVDRLIQSRSNGAYDEIASDAGDIIRVMGDDLRFNYFFSQIANKLARIKHRYSVEDSLLDIAGYATLELKRLRNEDV